MNELPSRFLFACKAGWIKFARRLRPEPRGIWATRPGQLLGGLFNFSLLIFLLVTLFMLLALILMGVIDWLKNFVRVVGVGEVTAWAAASLVLICIAFAARRPISIFLRSVFVMVLTVLYYCSAVAYYGLFVATSFSLLAAICDSINSFLTSPLGIKPNHIDDGFGEFFWPLLLSTLAAKLIFWVSKRTRLMFGADQ